MIYNGLHMFTLSEDDWGWSLMTYDDLPRLYLIIRLFSIKDGSAGEAPNWPKWRWQAWHKTGSNLRTIAKLGGGVPKRMHR